VEAVERRGLRSRANETIGGLEFDWVPETGDVPLVADMSSDILSRPIDVSRSA
jgi:phosphoserine aminotransferase